MADVWILAGERFDHVAFGVLKHDCRAVWRVAQSSRQDNVTALALPGDSSQMLLPVGGPALDDVLHVFIEKDVVHVRYAGIRG